MCFGLALELFQVPEAVAVWRVTLVPKSLFTVELFVKFDKFADFAIVLHHPECFDLVSCMIKLNVVSFIQ